MTRIAKKPAGEMRRRATQKASHPRKGGAMPLTTSRPELLLDGRDRKFRHLVHALLGFAARHEHIRDGHARVIGLAGIEYTVLIAIAHLSRDADVNVKTVADHLHLSGAFITSVTQRLLQLGLIHKETDAGDRRRVTLTVSKSGRDALERLAPIQRKVNDEEFGCLNHEEFELLTEIVDRLIDSGARAVALQNYLLSEMGLNGKQRLRTALAGRSTVN